MKFSILKKPSKKLKVIKILCQSFVRPDSQAGGGNSQKKRGAHGAQRAPTFISLIVCAFLLSFTNKLKYKISHKIYTHSETYAINQTILKQYHLQKQQRLQQTNNPLRYHHQNLFELNYHKNHQKQIP